MLLSTAHSLILQKKRFGKCEIKHDYLGAQEDERSQYLFLYITCVVYVIPAIIIGYAYIRTSLALLASIKKAKAMKNEVK